MRTHFELNSKINFLVGNLPVDGNDVAKMLQVIGRQRDLIHDEFDELSDGVRNKNISEVRDGIADVIVTVDGMYYRIGLEYPRFELWDTVQAPVDECLRSIEVDLAMIKEMLAVGLGLHSVGYFQHRLKVYCDSILEMCYRISATYGIDLQSDQEAVFESNMSKFDTDIEVARRGVEKYAALGVTTDLFPNEIGGVTYWVIKCTEDCVGTDGKKYNAGKFLKSVFFKEPVLVPLLDGAPILELFVDKSMQAETEPA